MVKFKLTADDISRLISKFEEFQKGRKKLHNLLQEYVADYRQFQGSSSEREKYLRGKYLHKAPELNHLLCENNGEIYWSAADISILMGRDRSSITRTLAKMEREDTWCSRLLTLRATGKAGSGLTIYVYHKDIFDLLIDRYEEEYLLRFSKPRRGDATKAPDIKEVRRFWNYLKTNAQIEQERLLHQEELSELAGLPPMGWKDIMSLIWGKLFTIRTGTFFSILFAVSFELARRWRWTAPWIVATSGLVLVACAMLLRFRKASPAILSDWGAVAFLFTLLWGAGLLSSDGTIHAPGGATFSLKEPEQKVILTPTLRGNRGQVYFLINTNNYNAKEFLYRISPDVEYQTTGFTQQMNAGAELSYPALTIPNRQTEGIVELEVKCVDERDKEQGPWKFSFNLNDERVKLRKQFFLGLEEPWVTAHRLSGRTFVEICPTVCFSGAGDTLSAVVYGINTGQPDTFLSYEAMRQLEEKPQIFSREEDDIQYVTSYLVFTDGASSDVRRNDLFRL